LKKNLLTFSKSLQKNLYLEVYIFTSKHLNEVGRCNEGLRKLKHHCPQDWKTHSDEETKSHSIITTS
jgi:hypothetical protein